MSGQSYQVYPVKMKSSEYYMDFGLTVHMELSEYGTICRQRCMATKKHSYATLVYLYCFGHCVLGRTHCNIMG